MSQEAKAKIVQCSPKKPTTDANGTPTNSKKNKQNGFANGHANNKIQNNETSRLRDTKNAEALKSVRIAYLLWFFGGFFGAHHLYLRRDRHAFVWWCTFGGYFGIGWLSEIFKIPELVRDANEDPIFIAEFNNKLRMNRKPPFSLNRFLGQIMVGYLWGQVVMIAIPDTEVGDIDWTYFHWLIPFGAALGVYTVGNIGREKGSFWWCLLASYVVYPLRYWVMDETIWFTGMVFGSAMIFDMYSKQWRLEPPKRHSLKHRSLRITVAVTVYLALWGSYFIFNGKITDSEGDEIPVHEAIKHFFTSPWWTDLKQTFVDTWNYGQQNGWASVWKQIIENMDAGGEMNAHKVLGLSVTASQTDIKTAWKKLSKENHPDKAQDPETRKVAHEKFMEIQQAYELLSKSKNKRRQKNKKYTEEG